MLSSTIPKTLFRSRLGVGASLELKKCPVVVYRPGFGYQQVNCCVSTPVITSGIMILDGGMAFASGLKIIDGGSFITTEPNTFDGGTSFISGLKNVTGGTAFSSGQKAISGGTAFSSGNTIITVVSGDIIVDGGKS
jgi:hypothetical protein